MSAPGERNHYQVLGVAEGANAEAIRAAHRQLARVLHPDRLDSAGAAERALAERRMREVNAAWTTLSDPTRRAAYDRNLRAAATGPASARNVPGAGSAGSGATANDGGSAPPPRSTGSRWPDDDDPDAMFARMRESELDPDEPPLTPAHFWLLRRGPILAAFVVAALLFMVTAYAGGNAARSNGEESVRTTAVVQECVRKVSGRPAVRVSCASENDGRIVTRVDAALDCPAGTTSVFLEERFTCITQDPSIIGSDITTTSGG